MKLKQSISLFLLSMVLISIGACTRQVTRIDPNNMGDISGRWNATDSRLVAEEMIDQVNRGPWKTDFVRAKNKKPVVIVGTIFNKSHEHIDAETFCKDL
ncbi:MAG: penicillin-binding protein activator LpoB, partial [Chitinophagaceae bacterium]|nr:penicillin-binding protein activator LpoB [Chitinophagaceae bacterium]